jgi:aminoglycoside phosphotransferase (APT) family kinase protein
MTSNPFQAAETAGPRDDTTDNADILTAIRRMGLMSAGATRLVPLTGGVASDIFRVESGHRIFVVKRALAKLRVAADWRAPVERNALEVAWLRVVAAIVPDAVPAILGHDEASGLFAMEWLPPGDHPVWKAELHAGRADPAFAAEVGRRLAHIHTQTANRPDLAARFDSDRIFHSIRLEPYLEATALRHPAVADQLMALSAETLATHAALVHGDVSPKNILCGPKGPVFLDAECAWYGDPAFDLAFCLNHLLLKCLWTASSTPDFLACFTSLHEAYGAVAGGALQARAARLLPALLLARVDGKSPVEYVTDDAHRALVRRVAIPLIAQPPATLEAIRAAWSEGLAGAEA